MIKRNKKTGISPIFLVSVAASIICILTAVILIPTPTRAAPPSMPPKLDPGLPPRPAPDMPSRPDTPPPDQSSNPSSSKSSSSSKSDALIGAYIKLHTQIPQASMWTVVQWQDSTGNWHDVEGWQGTFDGSQKIWWVDAKDFGKGPFRWVVHQGHSGGPLMVGKPFNLPHTAFETVNIEVPEP